MLDINTLGEFSRTNCGAICSFLVPASFVGAVVSSYNLYKGRSQRQITLTALAASVFPIVLFAHIATWWMVGVVMLPTFILLGLGSACMTIHLLAVAYPERGHKLLRMGMGKAQSWFNPS